MATHGLKTKDFLSIYIKGRSDLLSYIDYKKKYLEWRNSEQIGSIFPLGSSTYDLEVSSYLSQDSLGMGDVDLCSVINQLKDGMALSEKVLSVSPEDINLWNIRKKIVSVMLEVDAYSPEVANAELALILSSLKVNPKSYNAWYHRRWIMLKNKRINFAEEFNLLDKLFSLDPRNFHAWGYRNFLIEEKKKVFGAGMVMWNELIYTQARIFTNFSNYSSLTRRLVMLMESVKFLSFMSKLEKVKKELHLMKEIYFIDSNNQSIWFYNKVLTEFIIKEYIKSFPLIRKVHLRGGKIRSFVFLSDIKHENSAKVYQLLKHSCIFPNRVRSDVEKMVHGVYDDISSSLCHFDAELSADLRDLLLDSGNISNSFLGICKKTYFKRNVADVVLDIDGNITLDTEFKKIIEDSRILFKHFIEDQLKTLSEFSALELDLTYPFIQMLSIHRLVGHDTSAIFETINTLCSIDPRKSQYYNHVRSCLASKSIFTTFDLTSDPEREIPEEILHVYVESINVECLNSDIPLLVEELTTKSLIGSKEKLSQLSPIFRSLKIEN